MTHTTATADVYSAIDRSRIDQYKKLRPGFLERLLNAYLAESADYMGKLRNGAGGNDLETTRITAHALKSASINLGANRVGEICQEIESAAQQQDVAALGELIRQLGIEYFEAEQALRGVLHEVKVPLSA